MSDISKKLDALRGAGHSVPPGLEDILEDFDKRLAALEPKKADPVKADPVKTVPIGTSGSIFAPPKT